MGWMSHSERLYKFLKEVRALVANTEQNQREIKDLQGELREVAELLQALMFEIKRMDDRSLDHRENDKLRMKIFRLQVEALLGKPLSEDESDPVTVGRFEEKVADSPSLGDHGDEPSD